MAASRSLKFNLLSQLLTLAAPLALALLLSQISQTDSAAGASESRQGPPAIDPVWLDRAVDYEHCNSDQVVIIRSALIQGLNKIDTINHEVLKNRIKRNRNRTVTFDCHADEVLHENAISELTSDRELAIVAWTKQMLWGYRPKHSTAHVGSLLVSEKYSLIERKSSLLHEFLHFLEFDNLATEIHNDPLIKSHYGVNKTDILGFDYDVVFSCSLAAFEPDGLSYLPSQIAAFKNTCSAARINGRTVDVNLNDLHFLPEGAPRVNASVGCLIQNSRSFDVRLMVPTAGKACAK
jgi:hypothetical protein